MDFFRRLEEIQSNAVYIFRGPWVNMSGRWSLSILIRFCILDTQSIKQQFILYALQKTLSLVAPELRVFFYFSPASDCLRVTPALCKTIFKMEPDN